MPLAAVVSPDFAAAVSAYRKALVTAAECPPAGRHGQGSAARTRAFRSAKRNRPRPMPPAPKPTATPRCRRCSRSTSIRRPSGTSRHGKPTAARRRRDPRADRRHGGGKADHARASLLQAGTTRRLHRRRSFAGLGDGAGFRFRPRRGACGRQRPGDHRRWHRRRLPGRSTTSPPKSIPTPAR